jgi:hypothetical protein
MSTQVAIPSVWWISKRWRRFFDSSSMFAFVAAESALELAPGSAPKKVKSSPAGLLLGAGGEPDSGNFSEGATGGATGGPSAGRPAIDADSFSGDAGTCARAASGVNKTPRANSQDAEVRVMRTRKLAQFAGDAMTSKVKNGFSMPKLGGTYQSAKSARCPCFDLHHLATPCRS